MHRDRQPQKSTTAETDSFTDTCAPDTSRESWRKTQPCREAGRHTQETDRNNRDTLSHKFSRSTLNNKPFLETFRPTILQDYAQALSSTLPLRETHLDN